MKEVEIYLVVERLSRLSDEEIITSEIGLREPIEGITRLLRDNESKLKNTADPGESYTIDEMITKIDEVAYQIEDAIENRDVIVRNNSRKNSKIRCFGLLASCLSRLYDPHASIKYELERLHGQVKNVLGQLHSYHRSSLLIELGERVNYSKRPDCDPVGISEVVKDQVIQRLCNGSKNLEVISLCGVGGVGKTTLAHVVFNDARISYEFFNKIWIHVSSKFNSREMLMHVLSTFTRRHAEYKEEQDKLLVDLIADYISKAGKCLIVVDDVWSTQVLDELRRVFPNNNRDHRILLTTRKKQVAEYGFPKPFVFTVRGLTENGAWELFMEEYRRHNIAGKLIRAEMEDIGRQIVKRCEGFPVAIIKLGRELAGRDSLEMWNVVHQNVISFLRDSVLQVLAPSFDDLPDRLKPCFIYMGLWPEDSVIDVEKLYHFWIVEGFLKLQDIKVGGTAFNVAEQYLTELAEMGMIEVEEEEAPATARTLKYCRVNRIMRQLCISNGKPLNFFDTIESRLGSDSSSRNKTRRLSICLEKPADTASVLTRKEHLRSLHILDPHKQQTKKPVRLSGKFDVEEPRLLRLLDFDGVEFGRDETPADGTSNNVKWSTDGLLEGISKLVHLRYLSFKRCSIDQLPLSINNLFYLQVLDLRVDDSITEMTLPNVLWKMRKMKHLYLPRMFRTYNGDKLRLDGLTELETLDNFITGVCAVTDLHTLTKLHNLAVKVDGDLSDLQFINKHVKQSSNKQIQLSVDIRNFDCFVEKRHSVIRELLQHPSVRNFCIEGHLYELPSKTKFSPSLTKIVLSGSELEKDPMKKLAKLPNLRVLILDDNAFEGTVMVSPASGFNELKRLELLNLEFLESWTVESNSMPKLSNIKIENCNKLRIPDGFKLLAALKELEIAKMPKQFVDMLQRTDRTQGEDIAIAEYLKITFAKTNEVKTSQLDEA